MRTRITHTGGDVAGRRLSIGWLLGVVLVLGAVLGATPREALAETEAYTSLIPTENDDAEALASKKVTFNGKLWYVIGDESTAENAGTVTLFAVDNFSRLMPNGDVKTSWPFNNSGEGNHYSTSRVINTVNWFITTGDFKDVADAIETIEVTTLDYAGIDTYDTATDVKLYLLSTQETNALPPAVRVSSYGYWLRSPGENDAKAAYVTGSSGEVNVPGSIVPNWFDV